MKHYFAYTPYSIVFFLLSLLSCGENNMSHATRSIRDVGNFTELSISSALQVELTFGRSAHVEIKGDLELIDDVITENKNGRLNLSTKRFSNVEKGDVIVFVTIPYLDVLEVSGASRLDMSGKCTVLKMKISGATEVFSLAHFGDLKLNISGASEVKMLGESENCKVAVSGAASLVAGDFLVKNLQLQASGAASVKVHALQNIDIMASGASSVRYTGPAKVGKRRSSGAAQVQHN
jgi:hypothetical protein